MILSYRNILSYIVGNSIVTNILITGLRKLEKPIILMFIVFFFYFVVYNNKKLNKYFVIKMIFVSYKKKEKTGKINSNKNEFKRKVCIFPYY